MFRSRYHVEWDRPRRLLPNEVCFLLILWRVKKKRPSPAALPYQAMKSEIVDGLRHGIDRSHRRLLHRAQRDWERLFAAKEPSDGCVRVRVHGEKARAARGSAFLPKRKGPAGGEMRPRLA
jgi:hypothetical protein